jgi:hypothetical protein
MLMAGSCSPELVQTGPLALKQPIIFFYPELFNRS